MKRQPAMSATRSMTSVSERSTKSTSRMIPAAAPGTRAARVATAVRSTPSVGMITLSIDETSLAQIVENPALLPPCHNQISHRTEVFCSAALWIHADMFLLCSDDVLRLIHEPSILSCPQAPAGDGALHAGGCAFFFS